MGPEESSFESTVFVEACKVLESISGIFLNKVLLQVNHSIALPVSYLLVFIYLFVEKK